jgi:hypothetical protein
MRYLQVIDLFVDRQCEGNCGILDWPASIGTNPTALADEGIVNGGTALWFRNPATKSGGWQQVCLRSALIGVPFPDAANADPLTGVNNSP